MKNVSRNKVSASLWVSLALVLTALVSQGTACEGKEGKKGACNWKKGKGSKTEASVYPPKDVKLNDNSLVVKLDVSGMTCDYCGDKVRDALHQVKGVQLVYPDLEANKVAVTYDKTQVKPEDLVKAINGHTGYKAMLPGNKKEGEV